MSQKDQANNTEEKFLGISVDADALKKIEAHLIKTSRLVLLGEIYSYFVHEINNQLNLATGSLALVKKFKNNQEKFLQKTQLIENALERISNIIKSLNNFSQMDSEAEIKNHSFSKMINEAISIAGVKAKKTFVSIKKEMNSDEDILCNEFEIVEALIYLLNNAIESAQTANEKWILIKLFEENNQIILQITDSGSNIPKEMIHQIFEPFNIPESTKEGSSLRLSICKRIIDSHKASISLVQNSPNTCFELRFNKMRRI